MLILNPHAFKQAEFLILHGKVDMLNNWSQVKPKHEAEEEFLSKNDWETYGKWFLAHDPSKPQDSKDSYQFLFGDFEKVYRSALVAIQQIAEQHNYTDIKIAVKELLRQVDKEPDVVEIASDESFPASDPPSW